jgi:succinoglycan biosynthesis protein ExoW
MARKTLFSDLLLARAGAQPDVSSRIQNRSDLPDLRPFHRACVSGLSSNEQSPQLAPILAVIVPYFQRKADILRRCLISIFDQQLRSAISIHVIVVDDTSPWPAKEELRDVYVPEHITVEIISRNNGGPSAARNTGLDSVPAGTEFIAFIDSDDTWRVDHIQRALDSLGSCNDLYFSDYLRWEGFTNLNKTKFGALVGDSSIFRHHAGVVSVLICPNAYIIPYAIQEAVAHTSTIVYRKRALSMCRFDEELSYAEDDLFLLDLLLSSTYACISTESEASLGLGVNIFYGSWSWDSENNLKRCCDQLIFYTKAKRRLLFNREHDEMVRYAIRSYRPAVVFFMLRQLLKGRKVPCRMFVSLARQDPQFLVAFPTNIMLVVAQWIIGKLRGKEAFR